MSSNTVKTNRILSLDVFRGFTIVMMILVNSQGTPFPYPILDHAEWDGCTLADLVFPFFLFIVGLTSVISFKNHVHVTAKDKRSLLGSVLRRSILLFLIGLLLNAFPYHFDFASIRVYGILQRIALCYLICSVIYLNTDTKTQILIYFGILWFYWLIMTQIPLPGHSLVQITEGVNWVAYFDQMFFSSAHLFGKIYDPEGFLSTIPSVATTLAGVITGTLLLTELSHHKKWVIMIFMGTFLLLLGWFWNFSFPINKNLWTSSFVLWTSGSALIVFSLFFLIIDIFSYTKWALPFKIFGMNALFAFIFHVVLLKIQSMFFFPLKNGVNDNLRLVLTEYLFGGYTMQNASLFYALTFLLLNFLVLVFLYKRKIFIKI